MDFEFRGIFPKRNQGFSPSRRQAFLDDRSKIEGKPSGGAVFSIDLPAAFVRARAEKTNEPFACPCRAVLQR
jgi:hypothetical protein